MKVTLTIDDATAELVAVESDGIETTDFWSAAFLFSSGQGDILVMNDSKGTVFDVKMQRLAAEANGILAEKTAAVMDALITETQAQLMAKDKFHEALEMLKNGGDYDAIMEQLTNG